MKIKIKKTNRLTDENKLTTKYPALVEQWNVEKNGDLTPDMVSYGSNLKVWWKCSEGHEWPQAIRDRSKNSKIGECKVCNAKARKGKNKRIKPGNSLAERCPESLEYWDYEKNDGRTPADYSFSKTDEVWWKCPKGHTFKRRITDFRSRLHKCKECVQTEQFKVIRPLNVMSNYDFAFIKEFDESKNGLKINEVSIKSLEKVWWKCSEGHEWQDSPKNRLAGYDCSRCLKRKNYRLDNLESAARKMWDANKNEISTDGQYHYDKKVWWKCSEGHGWKEEYRRLKAVGYCCPECAGVSAEDRYKLVYVNPELAVKFDQEKNNTSINELGIFNKQKHWWKCSEGHSFYKTLKQMEEIKKCEECAGTKLRKVSPNESIAAIYPERAKMWHPTLNGILEPTDFTFGTRKKFWWVCENGHANYENVTMNTSPGQRKHKKCAQCKNEPGIHSVESKYPQLVKYWDEEKNKAKPNMVFADSKKTYRWKCEKGHTWREYIGDQVENDGCPICVGNVFLKPEKGQSFAEICPELVEMWDSKKNGDLTPWDVTSGTCISVWWKCEEGHSFSMPVINLKTRVNKCPNCKSRDKDEMRKMWDVEMNGGEFDESITRTSKEKYWFKCGNGHSELKSPLQIYSNKRCKSCNRKGKSKLKEMWDEDKNGREFDETLLQTSKEKYWFKCKNGHSELKSPLQIYSKKMCKQCKDGGKKYV